MAGATQAASGVEIELAEPTLSSLDQASVEAVLLIVSSDERPLQGLAGLCDWRLCGALSRTLEAGWFKGAAGEALLAPTHGRIPPRRIFAFGVGPRSGAANALPGALAKATAALRLARVASVALALPWPELALDRSLDLWLECSAAAAKELNVQGGPTRQLWLGDVRAMRRWIEDARARCPAWRLRDAERQGPSPLPSRREVLGS